MRTLVALFLLALSLVPRAEAQATFTQCAPEGGTCNLTASKLMRYGHPFGAGAWTATRTLGPGAIPCTNAYWGDPASGIGKRCEVMDAPAVPPPLPPAAALPLGTARYEITWTPATTNTDGTPIGPILSTAIQVSDTADFSRSLQWLNSGPGTGYVVSQAPNLPILFWRARHTTAAGDSAWTTPAVRTERQLVAASRPSCWPKPIGSGTWSQAAQNSAGWALYWQCTSAAGVPSHAGAYGLWSLMDADWMRQLAAALAAGPGAFDTLWNERASGPMDAAAYVAVRPLWDAMRDATPLPAAERWTVRALTGSTARPAWALAAGVRSTAVQAGRVAIGRPCDCGAHKSGTASTTYCAVTGQPNVAPGASGVLAASAAICARVP